MPITGASLCMCFIVITYDKISFLHNLWPLPFLRHLATGLLNTDAQTHCPIHQTPWVRHVRCFSRTDAAAVNILTSFRMFFTLKPWRYNLRVERKPRHETPIRVPGCQALWGPWLVCLRTSAGAGQRREVRHRSPHCAGCVTAVRGGAEAVT